MDLLGAVAVIGLLLLTGWAIVGWIITVTIFGILKQLKEEDDA